MLQDEQFIIESLAISDWAEDAREVAVIEATMRIGNAIIDAVGEERFTEYKAIVDDNQEVIDRWLGENVPDYKDTPTYQEIAAGYEEDPERNNPAKLFATVAWVQANVPNLPQLIQQTLDSYKEELTN